MLNLAMREKTENRVKTHKKWAVIYATLTKNKKFSFKNDKKMTDNAMC